MDIDTIRGLFTALMLVLFVGIVIWAYSKRRKQDFEEAANLPFQDEEPAGEQRENKKGKGNE